MVGLPEACIRDVTLSDVSIDSGDGSADKSGRYGIELRHMTGTFTNVTSSPPDGLNPFTVEENVNVKDTSGSTLFTSGPQPGQIACSQQTWFQ